MQEDAASSPDIGPQPDPPHGSVEHARRLIEALQGNLRLQQQIQRRAPELLEQGEDLADLLRADLERLQRLQPLPPGSESPTVDTSGTSDLFAYRLRNRMLSDLDAFEQDEGLTNESSSVAARRIELAWARGDTDLDLSNMDLISLPKQLGALDDLERLTLRGNSLIDLPDSIAELTGLKKLDVSNNELDFLPEFIGRLPAGVELDFRHNRIGVLPSGILHDTLGRLRIFGNPLLESPEAVARLAQARDDRVPIDHEDDFPERIGEAMADRDDISSISSDEASSEVESPGDPLEAESPSAADEFAGLMLHESKHRWATQLSTLGHTPEEAETMAGQEMADLTTRNPELGAFIGRLTETAEFDAAPDITRKRAERMLDHLREPGPLRERILDRINDAMGTCGDRIELGLDNIGVEIEEWQRTGDGSASLDDITAMAGQRYRLAQLDDEACKYARKCRQQGEELEYVLQFRTGTRRLTPGLIPGQSEHMLFRRNFPVPEGELRAVIDGIAGTRRNLAPEEAAAAARADRDSLREFENAYPPFRKRVENDGIPEQYRDELARLKEEREQIPDRHPTEGLDDIGRIDTTCRMKGELDACDHQLGELYRRISDERRSTRTGPEDPDLEAMQEDQKNTERRQHMANFEECHSGSTRASSSVGVGPSVAPAQRFNTQRPNYLATVDHRESHRIDSHPMGPRPQSLEQDEYSR